MVSVDAHADGGISYRIRGEGQRGESPALFACQILIQRLNQDGARWNPPEEAGQQVGLHEQGVDCIAQSNEGAQLLMQHTRADGATSLWRELATVGESQGDYASPEEAGEALKRAIENKSRLAGRRNIVLVLDGTTAAGPIPSRVASRFSEAHGT
ncbi:MAG: hypothetical protein WED87_04680, partial [Dehalococcoidia bacterium]